MGDIGTKFECDVSLSPRKTHKRSNSDIPFGFSTILRSSSLLISLRGAYVKRESSKVAGMWERKCEGEVVDDMFNAYLNLNSLGRLNTFRAENGEDLDSRASGTKANGGDSSDNEATSSITGSGTNNMHRPGVSSVSDKREGIKRSTGGDIAPMTRHYIRVSIDSVMGKMNFMEDSLKLPPSPGGRMGKIVYGDSIDPNIDTFNLEFGNGMFNGAKLNKIMANENLAEMALTDPKSVKRLLLLDMLLCHTCDDLAGNSFVYDPNLNSFNDSPNVFNHPPQPQTYSCELCGNDSHYGYDCPPWVPLVYEQESCYNQNFEHVANLSTHTPEPSLRFNSIYYDDDDDEERTIPLNEIISQLPPSIAITPVLPTMEPKDSLIMGDKNLSTIPEKESDEFIKSSVEDLVPIKRESKDMSNSDKECDLLFCDNSVTFSNPLFDSNDDFTSSDDDSLPEEDV
ncbi:hypothetical protein Tco_0711419 [Tanacetum coccineum]